MALNNDFDITGNVKAIEKLKCELLRDVSDLFANLQTMNSDPDERSEILAELIINAYVLSGKLGSTPSSLDEKILSRLKLCLLDEIVPLNSDYKELYRYLHRT